MAGFSMALGVSAAWLLLLGWLVGRTPARRATEPLDAIAVAASSPGVAIVLAVGALVLAAWAIRQLALQHLARRPGRIEVGRFAEPARLADADAEELTIRFRRLLSTLRLQAPTPVPGAAPEGDFVDVLSRNGMDARNLLGSLLGLLRAAKPNHAYEVRGVLLDRRECPRHGVAIEVLRLPSQTLLSATLWGATWDEVLTEAADEATAAILPHTRRCLAPWGTWRGQVMPRGLLHAHEQGARFEQQRRYDEALRAYFRAVEADPMNMSLRLRLGQLQERMGLFLDALATYWGMEVTQAGSPGGRRFELGADERRRALDSARYRRNVLLGGRVLAEQWRTVPDDSSWPSRRDEQRKRLRDCLRPRLREALRPYAEDGATLDEALAEPAGDDKRIFLSLRGIFARYALADCKELRRELRRRRGSVTTASVRLTEVCIDVRLASVEHEMRLLTGGDDAPVRAWPPDPDDLQRRIRRIERTLLPLSRSFRSWHEQYNAASAYALALQDQDLADKTLRTTLAERAVCRLQHATRRADSAFIASRRDWLVSEDPDLIGLRTRPEFSEFEMLFLPTAGVTRPRPRNVQQLDSARYVRALLVATAGEWHAAWHRRADDARRSLDIHVLHGWFQDELEVWLRTRAVALHYRHPLSRFELLEDIRRCADRYGFQRPVVAFPRYETASLSLSEDVDCDEAASRSVRERGQRLRRLAEILRTGMPGEPSEMLDELEQWRDSLRARDAAGQPVPRAELERLCKHHAALWQLLGQWLDASEASAGGAERQFSDMTGRTRLLWRDEDDRRPPHAVSAAS
jgi:hypothetical protein